MHMNRNVMFRRLAADAAVLLGATLLTNLPLRLKRYSLPPKLALSLALLAFGAGQAHGATAYLMSSGDYLEDFADIAN